MCASVHTPSCFLDLTLSWQMDPVANNVFNPVSDIARPARLSIVCPVGAIPLDDTFTVSLSQDVRDASLRAHICVCACLRHSPTLPFPLLFPNAIAVVSGIVLTFRNHVFIVRVDDVTSLPQRRRVEDNHLPAGSLEEID